MYLFPFTPWLFIAVIMLMFLLPVFAYLISGKPKKTFGLAPAIFCLILAFVVSSLSQIGFNMFWPIFAIQIFLATVTLWLFIPVGFQFPTSDGVGKEAKIVFWSAAIIPLYSLILLLINITGFFRNPRHYEQAPSHFWFLPLAVLLISTSVNWHRWRYFKEQHRIENTYLSNRHLDAFKRLFPAGLFLAFGLVLTILRLIFNDVAILVRWAEMFQPMLFLLALGFATSSILGFVDARNTLAVRLMGLVLVVLLTIFGIVGLNLINLEEEVYAVTQMQEKEQALQIYRAGETIEYPKNLIYIATFPATGIDEDTQVDLVYQSEAGADLSAESLGFFDNLWLQSASADELWITRVVRETLFVGRGYVGYQFSEGDQVVEFGFPTPWQNETSHLLVSRSLTWVVVSTLVALIIFPIIFRRILVNPLNELLMGVEQVNGGDLQTMVPVTQNDEIGYLTRSFNDMTASLLALNEGLEDKVALRTAALQKEIIEREKAELEAIEANKAKSTFLANMSHDLRTPLNAILGYAQVMQTNPANVEQNAEIIQRSGTHLLVLIDDILDLSKVESGQFALREQEANLRLFLDRIYDMTTAVAEAKGLSFSLISNVPDSVFVMVDPTRLSQVLVNLIDNAIYYTESGSVTVFVEQVLGDQSDEMVQIFFAIQDSGIGIAKNDLAEIFQPYYQVNHVVSKGGKSGLGLAIASELVRAMGGMLEVDSERGRGSKFYFSLDLYLGMGLSAVNPKQQHTQLLSPAPHIFIVDDNNANRQVLDDMLAAKGFVVTCYEEARSALEDAKNDPPDVIITDIFMPEFNGYQFIAALRKHPETADMPIVAASASVFPDDEKQSREAGADFFLPKPVVLTPLLDILTELLALEWQSNSPQTVVDEPFVLPAMDVMQALVRHAEVGDLGSLQQCVKRLAEAEGYRPFIAKLQPFLSTLDMEELQIWLETTIEEKELNK